MAKCIVMVGLCLTNKVFVWTVNTNCYLPLQANLPLLQRELLHCARLAKQNPAQYLAQHEQLLLDTSITSPVETSELLMDVNENGKRRTPDRWAWKNKWRCSFKDCNELLSFPILSEFCDQKATVSYKYKYSKDTNKH